MLPPYEPIKGSDEHERGSGEPLIVDFEKSAAYGLKEYPPQRSRKLWPWVMHSVIFIMYSIAYLLAFTSEGSSCPSTAKAYSPANEAIKYTKTVSYHGGLHEASPYRGKPRPELDKAWHDLLEHNNIRISKEELQRMNRTAIELYDGSGFFGQLSAYHHLHCLKFIRQVLHPEYYDTNTTDRDEHVDHCIDDLRQALMCHADPSIVTFDWKGPNWRRPWPNFNIEHTCVDWDALGAWAAERSFDIYDQHTVVHPNLGKLPSRESKNTQSTILD
ncbi:hypothetical protein O1611_g346 [Lasiodiplodia mahajangana]|uniref:Uncharacterized protein n=1 Tax=Lasiodiplodia mahajangana TaxID=1108764 RepID=A0ACC2K1E8_9PEZI|nr:hypothetical protein O1611_g346 [Lasiodiplodia mahajangana]